MAINVGQTRSFDPGKASTSAAGSGSLTSVGTAPDTRRLYDFSDRVAELSPEESPFFVYLSKMSKVPTDDSVFRFLEDRSRIDWTSRNFFVQTSTATDVTVGSSHDLNVDDGSSSPIKWLVKGMVFALESDKRAQSHIIFRVETVSHGSTNTSISAKCVALSNSANDGTNYNDVEDNDECQVIGTSFQEGSGSPDVWSSEVEDDFGYTQIFKTAAELTNTVRATNYRGYADEWQRVWAMKLREHKVDIERAMLFSHRARVDGYQYTEGVVGHILKNATAASSASYTSGAPYHLTLASTSFTYDQLLGDLQVIFDPARGGQSNKLALASLPVVTYMNKMGATGFVNSPTAATEDNALRYNLDVIQREGSFGHSIMQIDTIHGSLSLVKEPLFRGIASGFLLMVDMSQCAYRPLVGNGVNRDTHVITNVQQADEDLRKDMIMTEAGLEVTIPETHALYAFTDL